MSTKKTLCVPFFNLLCSTVTGFTAKNIPLFPDEPITSLHCRPNGCMSVPLSSIGAPPEDNAQPANEAAVTGSDSRWGAEGHRHQMVKVNHRVCNSEQNFNLQRAFIQVTGGERQHAESHRGLVIWSWQVAAPKEQPETHKTNSLTPSPGQMFKEIQLRVLI